MRVPPFTFLKAIGRVKALPPIAEVAEVTEPLPARLSDPTGDAITHHLIDRGLWRYGAGLGLIRDGRRLTLRVFLPEHQQSDRTIGAGEATTMRQAVREVLNIEGYTVRFTDALFCERGTKGWVVLARAEWRS